MDPNSLVAEAAAAGGGGGAGSLESTKEELIIQQIQDLLSKRGDFSFSLSFVYKGRPFSTNFIIQSYDDEIGISNPCIILHRTLKKENGTPSNSDIYTHLYANSDTQKCFTPLLKSNNRNAPNRITSGDVLQILKTKLAFILTGKSELPLHDLAMKDGIFISKFNLLRGGDAYYEKYGYTSDGITDLKDKLKSATWGNIVKDPQILNIIHGLMRKLIRTDEDDDDKIIDIMKKISWQSEKHLFDTQNLALDKIFTYFANEHGYGATHIMNFTVKKDNPKWIACNSDLVFTDLTMQKGGRRKTKKKTR